MQGSSLVVVDFGEIFEWFVEISIFFKKLKIWAFYYFFNQNWKSIKSLKNDNNFLQIQQLKSLQKSLSSKSTLRDKIKWYFEIFNYDSQKTTFPTVQLD